MTRWWPLLIRDGALWYTRLGMFAPDGFVARGEVFGWDDPWELGAVRPAVAPLLPARRAGTARSVLLPREE